MHFYTEIRMPYINDCCCILTLSKDKTKQNKTKQNKQKTKQHNKLPYFDCQVKP